MPFNFVVIAKCKNDKNALCLVPFTYDNKLYYKCTTAPGNYNPWCYDERGNNNWGYCSKCPGMYGTLLYLILIESLRYNGMLFLLETYYCPF